MADAPAVDEQGFYGHIIDVIERLFGVREATRLLRDSPEGPDLNLFDLGLLTSLAVPRLLVALEEFAHVVIPVDKYGVEAFFTLRAMRNMVVELTNAPE
jgi:hypothetical protein